MGREGGGESGRFPEGERVEARCAVVIRGAESPTREGGGGGGSAAARYDTLSRFKTGTAEGVRGGGGGVSEPEPEATLPAEEEEVDKERVVGEMGNDME